VAGYELLTLDFVFCQPYCTYSLTVF